jgi:DsbC/DsbD-like thiol-disulfide interchange protein
MTKALLRSLAVCAALLLTAGVVSAQGKSGSVVKMSATAEKPAEDGTQVVTITLTHDKGWHTYANPVDNIDLADAQTLVTITGKGKPEVIKIEYPAGKVVKDKVVGDYKVFEEKVTIKATVKRAKGDTEKLEVGVKLQACNDKTCLAGETLKSTVP